jgi:hypothetical protein
VLLRAPTCTTDLHRWEPPENNHGAMTQHRNRLDSTHLTRLGIPIQNFANVAHAQLRFFYVYVFIALSCDVDLYEFFVLYCMQSPCCRQRRCETQLDHYGLGRPRTANGYLVIFRVQICQHSKWHSGAAEGCFLPDLDLQGGGQRLVGSRLESQSPRCRQLYL